MRRFTMKVPATSPVALVANTAKTVLYLKAGANLGVDVDEMAVFFDSTDATKGKATIEVIRFTTDCTVTSRTPTSCDAILLGNTSYVTGGSNSSSDGTAGDIVSLPGIDITGAIFNVMAVLKEFGVGKGERFGLRVTAPFACNCWPQFGWQE